MKKSAKNSRQAGSRNKRERGRLKVVFAIPTQ
jgi:hypothetical protein